MRGQVKRSTFESWIDEDLQKIREAVDRLLNRANVGTAEVDRVFLTGIVTGSGSTGSFRSDLERKEFRAEVSLPPLPGWLCEPFRLDALHRLRSA
jgi:hypothetical protein